MNPDIEFPNFTEDDVQYGYYFHYEEGGVFAWTEKELLDEEINIFRKFKSVLSLTYRRYIDLKEAEASSVEAVRQASLDRVRAEIASMRTSEDLNHITPIIWRELKILEVPFFRCGVFIVDEDQATVQVYLTTPDGKSLGVLNLPFDSNELTSNTFEFWRRKEVYKEHWNKEEFISWSKSMLELGQIKSQQEYQGAEKPPESLDLHFIPFEQGMLYVGNKEPLTLEKIDLVKSLADAFSIAYARYEDFEQLETAKKEVESAFGELDLLSKELKIKNEELESENQRKALELEEARQLQLSMLPKELPKLPTLDIAVYMKTATEVGGDYYDFYIHPNGTLTVLIGDATGHGMKSGMMVSIMKSFFIANRNNIELKHFFENSNKSIKDMQLGRLMMACMGVQITSKKVIATNAGMPSLIYFRNKSQKAGEFVINHMPLGAMNGSKYSLKEISYEKGDTLLLMSDGFGELMNKNNEQYGYPRIIKEFKSVVQKSSNEIVDHLKNSADKWIKGIEPDDDVTFVVIKVK
jgi:serine phosphatase RsbU (regulator of sigma subunit)